MASPGDDINRRPERIWLGPGMAALMVGIAVSPLWIGFEPVGGDPDRLYRPLKTELSRALSEWRLPHWSDRFGTGMPLIAESHIAAFYPPNIILYGLFDVAAAYRFAMWLHLVACAAITAVYALQCGVGAWGSALAGVAFTLCGSLAIHASHESIYCAIAYLPLCLWLCQRYVETGKFCWLASLGMASGVQWTIGHFQIQSWTVGLILIVGTFRVLADRHPRIRILGLLAAVGWGIGIAAVQLWPSWQLAGFVGQLDRSIEARSFYSYPPAHFAELALPRLFRDIPGGPTAAYWFGQQTTGFEAAFFIGTLPLILAFLGARRPTRALRPWIAMVVGSLALATMPQWWPEGYAMILRIPGIGFFRAPGRYTITASLGLALLAGRGLERSFSREDFRSGLVAAVTFGVLAALWAAWWTSLPQFASAFPPQSGVFRMGLPLATWSIAMAAILGWKRGKWPPWVILALTSLELGSLFYTTAVPWGRHVSLRTSPVLNRLQQEKVLMRVGGELENYPLYAGAATAAPYLGFKLPPPGNILASADRRGAWNHPGAIRWLRRLGVTHQVWTGEVDIPAGSVISRTSDKILDCVVERKPAGEGSQWTIIRLPEAYPPARAATRVRSSSDPLILIRQLTLFDEPDVAHYLLEDMPAEASSPRASRAIVTSWKGTSGVVEHDGACDLIITRTFYPGWTALVNGKYAEVHLVDGGLQGVRLDDSGISRVELLFQPAGRGASYAISLAAILAALTVLIAARRKQPHQKDLA